MDPSVLLERQNMASTAAEDNSASRPSQGWQSLGSSLVPGASEARGEAAYEGGLRIGAQTANALAEARQRVNDAEMGRQAGNFIATNAENMGISPEAGGLARIYAEKGAKPEELSNMVQGFQKAKLSAMIADPNGDPNAQYHAGEALDPSMMKPTAVGQAGSFIAPSRFNPNDPKSNPVTITPEQSTLNTATANERQHSADRPFGQAGIGTLKHGNEWVPADPNDPTKGVLIDSNGMGVQRPTLNANPGEGAIGERYTRRVVNAQNGLAKEAENLRSIGLDASTEAQVGPGKGVMGTLFENAGKTFSSEKSQNYKATMAGIENQLGTIELAGQVPPGTYQNQLKSAVENTGADTMQNRMFHAARLRQIAEVAAESAADNPKMSDTARNGIYAAVNKIQQSIPFTTSEVLAWGKHGKAGESFQQYLDRSPRDAVEHFGPQGGAAPAADSAAPAAAGPSGHDPLNILGKK